MSTGLKGSVTFICDEMCVLRRNEDNPHPRSLTQAQVTPRMEGLLHPDSTSHNLPGLAADRWANLLPAWSIRGCSCCWVLAGSLMRCEHGRGVGVARYQRGWTRMDARSPEFKPAQRTSGGTSGRFMHGGFIRVERLRLMNVTTPFFAATIELNPGSHSGMEWAEITVGLWMGLLPAYVYGVYGVFCESIHKLEGIDHEASAMRRVAVQLFIEVIAQILNMFITSLAPPSRLPLTIECFVVLCWYSHDGGEADDDPNFTRTFLEAIRRSDDDVLWRMARTKDVWIAHASALSSKPPLDEISVIRKALFKGPAKIQAGVLNDWAGRTQAIARTDIALIREGARCLPAIQELPKHITSWTLLVQNAVIQDHTPTQRPRHSSMSPPRKAPRLVRETGGADGSPLAPNEGTPSALGDNGEYGNRPLAPNEGTPSALGDDGKYEAPSRTVADWNKGTTTKIPSGWRFLRESDVVGLAPLEVMNLVQGSILALKRSVDDGVLDLMLFAVTHSELYEAYEGIAHRGLG
ncbi:uncharacterized protein EV422DRAFT_502420 [Fimicolochytrium jonesii]|uniref:uncharacterized protein n=1 Tax=Fimicolochytrium jonesii TaxID=1396493 RepID=UPI0022FE1136|nr:uncharacterized protein EV422DRAFT_502420 [Fimicolochytrium jonesii]KAI8826644.1 hypothetical protein EV422DRAFT_502420 [Fimicolochytrium jonesii]